MPKDETVFDRLMHGDTQVMNEIAMQSTSDGVALLWDQNTMLPITGRDALDAMQEYGTPDRDTRDCLVCPAEVSTPDGMYRHWMKNHPELWMDLTEWISKGQPDMPARMNASNRQVYAQMRLWGWTEEKKTNLEIVMRHPNGSTLKIHAPESHARNEVPVLLAIFQMTGVTAEEFWEKEGEEEARFQPEPVMAAPPKEISTPLLDLLIGQGRPLTVQWMAESLGFSVKQVLSAMSYMKQRKLVKRVKRGMWMAVDHREVTETQTVDIQATVNGGPDPKPETLETPLEAPVSPASPETGSVPVPTPPAAPRAVQPVPAHQEVTDMDILQLLDILVPEGFHGVHYPAVFAWVEATKQLVRSLKEN
jgi:hypothetical protein